MQSAGLHVAPGYCLRLSFEGGEFLGAVFAGHKVEVSGSVEALAGDESACDFDLKQARCE